MAHYAKVVDGKVVQVIVAEKELTNTSSANAVKVLK